MTQLIKLKQVFCTLKDGVIHISCGELFACKRQTSGGL